MARALVGLGSNLGDRAAHLQAALAALSNHRDLHLAASSAWHETTPVGGPGGQGAYVNAAAIVETSLGPAELWVCLAAIEAQLGRRREVRWGPRTIDLDLLLYDETELETATLVVPHPRMAFRRFVLTPAAEIAGAWRHPIIGWTLAHLLENLDRAPDYLALAGVPGAGKTEVAMRLAAAGRAHWLADSAAPASPTEESSRHDPTGQLWARELEFLAKRRDVLDAQRPAPAAGWIVSDFWFGQSPAYAEQWMTAEPLERYTQLWQEASARVRWPKLLVLLDPGLLAVERRLAGRPLAEPADTSARDRLRAGLVQHAMRSGNGPVLRLTGDELPPILDELQAAIAAMK